MPDVGDGGAQLLRLLLLQSGDVETNPGPPRRAPATKKPAAEPAKDKKEDGGDYSSSNVNDKVSDFKFKLSFKVDASLFDKSFFASSL